MTSFNDRRVWPRTRDERDTALEEHFGSDPEDLYPAQAAFHPEHHGEKLGVPVRTTRFADPYKADRTLEFQEGPPVRVAQELLDPRFGPHGMRAPTGTVPVTHVYRGMHPDEWAEAQRMGEIRSSGQGAIIPEWEGTNASVSHKTAAYYLPEARDQEGKAIHEKVPGSVVAKIAVHPDEDWFTTGHDSYLRTRKAIPVHRVEATMTFAPPDWSDRRSSAEDR